MSILVQLTPMEEAQLSDLAMQNGLDPARVAEQFLRERLISEPVSLKSAVEAKLRQWQAETDTKTSPAIPARELFARWAEEDAQMTDEEKEAEDRLWQDFQQGINESRSALGMRLL